MATPLNHEPKLSKWVYAAVLAAFVAAALLGVTIGLLWTHTTLW